MGNEGREVNGGSLPGWGYVLNRLREDSRHASALSAVEGQIGHPGVKGRFRELLVNNLLVPWLPAAVGCGTGLIVDHEQRVMEASQDDVILFDQFLAPSVLASSGSTHGVYLFDNVLCRVEVKSSLAKADLAAFVEKSKTISGLRLAARPDRDQREVFGALNFLVAFDSQVARGQELSFLIDAMRAADLDPLSGVVSGMCIGQVGFWILGRTADGIRAWKQLRVTEPEDPFAYLVGLISNSCFDQRAARLGIEPVGGGIGLYLDHPFDFVGGR